MNHIWAMNVGNTALSTNTPKDGTLLVYISRI